MHKLFLLTILTLLLTACSFKQSSKTNQITQKPEEIVQTQAPTEVLTQTGEVDQVSFEEVQEVSEDDSLEAIEQELLNTIILDEEFGDLGF